MTGVDLIGKTESDGSASGRPGREEPPALSIPRLARQGSAHLGPIWRSTPASLCVGQPVGGAPYVVVHALGQGGMGEVYEVAHVATGVRRALKVLHPHHRDRADLAERMRQEARLLAAVDHPAVVRLLDSGQTRDHRPYLVMELLRGYDLSEILARDGPMPVPEALLVIAEALDGLAAIHAAGIVHRDVKLENLFLCNDRSIKVVDFGVAKARWAAGSPTVPGVSLGTPRTMAPEQCALRGVDPRADIYAAGLALYELCVGRGPFDDLRDQPQALRFAHCVKKPPPPAAIAPQPIPAAVEAAILRAIAKSPDDRFQSAEEMASALRRLVAPDRPCRAIIEPRAVPPGPLPKKERRAAASRRRRGARGRATSGAPTLLAVLSLLLFALGLFMGHALAQPSVPQEPENPAARSLP
jgi:serine/threonine protein kinase